MKKFLLVYSTFFLANHSYSQTREPVKVTDMLKIRSINGINLSNDGSKAVFTVTTIEPDGESKWDEQIREPGLDGEHGWSFISKATNCKRGLIPGCMES